MPPSLFLILLAAAKTYLPSIRLILAESALDAIVDWRSFLFRFVDFFVRI
jgi:hypothetical protein